MAAWRARPVGLGEAFSQSILVRRERSREERLGFSINVGARRVQRPDLTHEPLLLQHLLTRALQHRSKVSVPGKLTQDQEPEVVVTRRRS